MLAVLGAPVHRPLRIPASSLRLRRAVRSPAVSPVRAMAASAFARDWASLKQEAGATATGQRLSAELLERQKGAGPAHTDSALRLFGAKEEDVRVTLYRDSAAWCPYCQKARLPAARVASRSGVLQVGYQRGRLSFNRC